MTHSLHSPKPTVTLGPRFRTSNYNRSPTDSLLRLFHCLVLSAQQHCSAHGDRILTICQSPIRWRVDSRLAISAKCSNHHTVHSVSKSLSTRRKTSSAVPRCACERLRSAEVRLQIAACSRSPASPRPADASSTVHSFPSSSTVPFWSWLTNATSSIPMGTNRREETEWKNGSVGQEPSHTDTAKHAMSKETWSGAGQDVPFLRPRSPGHGRRRHPPLSNFRLVLGHLYSFWPVSSRIVISVMPYPRGNTMSDHHWRSGWVRWPVGKGRNHPCSDVPTVSSCACNSTKEQWTQSQEDTEPVRWGLDACAQAGGHRPHGRRCCRGSKSLC